MLPIVPSASNLTLQNMMDAQDEAGLSGGDPEVLDDTPAEGSGSLSCPDHLVERDRKSLPAPAPDVDCASVDEAG
jgi:hypothetical protein